MNSIPIRVWIGMKEGKRTLIAGRSERRTAEILGIPIIELREWDKSTPYSSWMEIGKVYTYHQKSGLWEEEV